MYKIKKKESFKEAHFVIPRDKNKLEKLQRIWETSHPHNAYPKLGMTTQEDEFRKEAKNQGFSEADIIAFLKEDINY